MLGKVLGNYGALGGKVSPVKSQGALSKPCSPTAKPPHYSSEVKPKWCGKCDEVSRKLNEWVDVPNGNGSKTQSCLECDPYLVNKANGY